MQKTQHGWYVHAQWSKTSQHQREPTVQLNRHMPMWQPRCGLLPLPKGKEYYTPRLSSLCSYFHNRFILIESGNYSKMFKYQNLLTKVLPCHSLNFLQLDIENNWKNWNYNEDARMQDNSLFLIHARGLKIAPTSCKNFNRIIYALLQLSERTIHTTNKTNSSQGQQSVPMMLVVCSTKIWTKILLPLILLFPSHLCASNDNFVTMIVNNSWRRITLQLFLENLDCCRGFVVKHLSNIQPDGWPHWWANMSTFPV